MKEKTGGDAAWLDDLRREYVASFPEKLKGLERLLGTLARSREDIGTASTLKAQLHRLRGTAGSFGLPEVTRLAGLWEDRLEALERAGRPPDSGELAQFLTYLDQLRGAAREELPVSAAAASGAAPGKDKAGGRTPPPVPAAPSTPPGSSAVRPGAGTSVDSSSGPWILVVEDDPELARLVSRSLTDLAMRPEIARDLPACLMAVTKGHADAVIADSRLAGRDLALVDALRERDPDIPVLITSTDPEGLSAQALSDSVDGWLAKPFDFTALATALTRLLSAGSARRRDRQRARVGFQLEVVHELAAAADGRIDVEAARGTLTSAATLRLGHAFSCFLLPTAGGYRVEHASAREEGAEIPRRLSDDAAWQVETLVLDGKPVVMRREEGVPSVLGRESCRVSLLVPILDGDALVDALLVEDDAAADFSGDDRRAFETMALLVGVARHRALGAERIESLQRELAERRAQPEAEPTEAPSGPKTQPIPPMPLLHAASQAEPQVPRRVRQDTRPVEAAEALAAARAALSPQEARPSSPPGPAEPGGPPPPSAPLPLAAPPVTPPGAALFGGAPPTGSTEARDAGAADLAGATPAPTAPSAASDAEGSASSSSAERVPPAVSASGVRSGGPAVRPRAERIREEVFSHLERYRHLETLGAGPHSIVYKVDDLELGEPSAMKVLLLGPGVDEARWLSRFKAELTLNRRIKHPNVARLFELGQAGAYPFVTMEWLSGGDLEKLLKREGALPPERAVPILRQIALGTQAAHEVGIVHRDLKPRNVMVDEKGAVAILDFGLARSMSGPGITQKGMVVGTPLYMSPEQALGKKVDHRSDLYAIGVMAFEMLTGKVPFDRPTPLQVSMAHLRDPIPLELLAEAHVPEPLQLVILTLLAKKPEERFTSAADLEIALAQVLSPGDRDSISSAELVALPPPTPAPRMAEPSGEAGGPGRSSVVLIVDDDPESRAFCAACLADKGVATLQAVGGEPALSMLQERDVDLVLMDVLMPGLDGFEVTRILRSQPRFSGLPVLLMSAVADRGRLAFALQAGASELLSKPLDPEVLAQKVKAVLDKRPR